jgi:aquaporin Z
MLKAYFAEAVGSFIFFSVVLTKGDAIMISVALLVGILIATVASKGHLNPAITAMVWARGDMSGEESIAYVVSQLVGAVAAVTWAQYIGGVSQAETFKVVTRS